MLSFIHFSETILLFFHIPSFRLLGGKGKIGTFRYAPLIGPDILSGILVKATGYSIFDFAAENLFSPLGITVENRLTFQNKEEQMAFNQSTNMSQSTLK